MLLDIVEADILLELYEFSRKGRFLSYVTTVSVCAYNMYNNMMMLACFFQDEFLDVVYWLRQILGVVIGLIWGLIPLKGLVGLGL